MTTKDYGDVVLPKGEAMRIMEEVRPRLVDMLVRGVDRKQANAAVAAWLAGQGNILSPYADYVVERLVVEQDEIDMRREHGDAYTDAFIKISQMMRETKAA